MGIKTIVFIPTLWSQNERIGLATIPLKSINKKGKSIDVAKREPNLERYFPELKDFNIV